MGQRQGSWFDLLEAFNPISLAVGQLWLLAAVWATRHPFSEPNSTEENEEITA